MGFAQEMKDFTAAYKTGSSIAKDWSPKEKSFAERKYDEEKAERKSAEDAGEAKIGKASTDMPGSAGSTVANKSPGALNTDGSPAMDGTTSETESRFLDTVKTVIKNPIGLAAVAATGKAESSWKPSAVNDSWNDPSESGVAGRSGGALSWRDSRYDAMLKHASEKGETLGKIKPETQASFFLKENPALIEKLNSAKTIDEAMSAMNAAWAFAGHNKPGHHEPARRRGYAQDYYRRFSGGRQAALPVEGNEEPTVFAAEGGLIEPEKATPVLGALDVEKPVEKPVAKAPVEDVSNSNSGGSGSGRDPRSLVNSEMANEAIDAGMRYLQQTFTSGGAIAEADPKRGAAIKAFARNDDVPSHDDVKAADAAIDPKGELAPHLRSIARLNGAYDMYMKKGEPEKAAKIAASMAMYSRKVAMSGGTQMQALIEKGNMAGAAKIAERVYNEMPNGHKVEIEPSKQGFNYKVFDIDGQPTDGGRMAIDQLMQLATGLQDGTAWFQAMGYMGGQAKTHAGTKSNQLGVRGSGATRQGTGAAPRTTATERASATETATVNAAEAGRQGAIAGTAGALNVTPDITPNRSNLPGNMGALPAELATVGAVPTTALPVQESEWGTGGGGAASIPYNAGTGVSRVMPAEGQDAPGELERSASRMATNTEREKKLGQLAQGAQLDQALANADKAYKIKSDRKGVRTTDTAANRTEAAEAIELGFQARTAKDGKEPAKLAPEKKAVVNSLATKIMRGNDGLTPEDAGRTLAEMLEKGPAMRADGSVGPRGGDTSVFLDSSSIRQIIKMYGGNEKGAKGVDPGLSPRNYRMPAENAGKPRMDDREAYEKLGRNAPPEQRKRWSDNASKAGAAMGALMGDIISKEPAKEPEPAKETTLERIRRRRREAEERAKK